MGDDAPRSIHDLTDDILKLILLRVPSSACLVRAAAACKIWRRVIADASFLRRFRSLHAHAVVAGYYHNSYSSISSLLKEPTTSFHPSFAASPSTAALAIDARHLSLGFVSMLFPGCAQATVCDSRGSLLLLELTNRGNCPRSFAMAVSEPLTQRCRLIPPPRQIDGSRYLWRSYYLVDGDADELGGHISMSNFRVLCEFSRDGIPHAALRSVVAGEDYSWSWSEKAINDVVPILDHRRRTLGRAGGSWYFYIPDMTTGIVLDGGTGEYSPFVLPATEAWDLDLDGTWRYSFFVTDGGDGKPRIVSLLDATMKVFARVDDGGGNGEWALEKRVHLPEIICGPKGYDCELSLFMSNCSNDARWTVRVWTTGPGLVILVLEQVKTGARCWFSVDLETMEVKRDIQDIWGMLHCCELPWPPHLHVCLDS